MTDTDKILDLDYTEQEFLQMMGFLQGKVKDFSPYISQPDDGYTYVFDTIENKNQFDRFFGINDEVAMQLVRYKWKNGVEKYMVINIEGEYVRNILLNSVGNVIKFDFYSAEGAGQRENEAGVVNVTITNDSGVKTMQQTFGLGSDKSINLDNYLVAGTNIVRISVTGVESKKVATTEVTYNVTEIDLSSDFNIAKIYGSGEIAKFNVKPKCNVQKYVEFWFDKETSMATQTSAIQPAENEVFVSLTLPTTSGKHILQMRCRADIDGKTCYSRTIYCEFVVRGEYIDFITIERKLHNSDIIQGEDTITLHCEQYVQEDIPWAYIPYRQGTSPIITWKLEPTAEGDSTTLSTRVTDGTTTEEGTVYHLSFLPSVTGTFNLKALIDENEIGSYYTEIIKNTSGLEETTNGLRCKFSALGRSNSEPENIRNTWKYNSYATEFTDVPWTNGCGWVDDALYISGGAKATIGVRPFIDLRQSAMATTGATVEIDFETTNIKDENAVLLSIGERLKIKGNSAEFSSVSGVTLTDKFVANKRLKLAFIVHKSNTSLMEIINNGVSSRCASYGSSYFLDNGEIVIGGTDKASIKIYSIRVYETNLDTQQELRNVTIDASDIAAMVERNNIYTGGEVDISLIEDRIACLYVTGKGGSNKLSTIWNSTDKVQIYADVRWRNPNNPESNWDCEAMRIRSHGQSTLANPLKSLKVWMKNDKKDASFTTKFFPNGATEPSDDPRWSMKPGAMPMNKFVFQCYYIDSSNCKSPAMLRMIDTAMKGADIITPPMRYVRDSYTKDMKAIHSADYTFPYNIRMTPDSVPCVIVSRDSDSEKWHYDGIFVLMDDKKSDYLYGERSIYSAIGDPYCFDVEKKLYQTLWDNKEVTRWEFLSNNHPISTFKDISSFFQPPIDYTEDDDLPEDPNEVQTLAEGGDSPTPTPSAGYAFEQAIEIIYPDRDDLDDAKYMMRANKVYEFFTWVNDCYKVDNGGSQAVNKLWNEASDHMELEHWAAYYVIAMMNGAFDNLVRNMQLTTFDGIHWIPLWWDLDIQYGTINSGPLAFDPPVDRTTENNYGIAFRGSDNFLWNALESTIGFTTLCRDVLNKLTKASYNKESVIALQREYTDTWSEALYNESEDYKYKQMYLKNMSGNAKYLAYLLGDGNTFREWWMTKNYRYWESRLAGGSFTSVGVSWRYSDINHRFSLRVSYGEDTFFGWALGQQTQMIGDRYSVEVKAGEEKVVTLPQISQSDRLYFFNPQSIEMLDISDSVQALQDIALGNCYDESTGSMLKYLYLGVADAALEEGVRNTQVNDQISDLNKMNMLEILQMQGIIAPSVSYNINKANNIREVRMKGSSCAEMILPNSVTLDIAELPDTLQSISWDAVKFKEGALKFFDPITLEESSFPHGAMTMEFKAMGNDQMIRQMIADWLEYKIQQNEIDGCKLSIQNIAWKNATYEDILRLAKIDRNLRNYTGVIMLDKALTSTQMYEIQTLFNDEDRGIDVFSSESAFQIDCNKGVSISAPPSIKFGESYKISCVVFPIFHKRQEIKYSIEGSRPYPDGKYRLYNATLDEKTGLLEVEENNSMSNNITVNVVAITVIEDEDGNETTMEENARATIQLVARTYPTKVELDGITNIEELVGDGRYEINALFSPADTDGSIANVTWSYNSLDCITDVSKDDTKKFVFYVSKIDNTTQIFNVSYRVQFKNGTSLSASLIVTIHEPVKILTNSSNPTIYNIMNFNGLTSNGFMTDMQAWNIRDEATATYSAMPWEYLNEYSDQITHFEEIKYFRYLTYVNFNGWYNLDTYVDSLKVEDYDFGAFENLKSIQMRGTVVSAKNIPDTLTTLHLGAPKNVYHTISQLSKSNFVIQDVSRVKTISLGSINYGFKTLASILSRKAECLKTIHTKVNSDGTSVESTYSINAFITNNDIATLHLELHEKAKTTANDAARAVITTESNRILHSRIEVISDIDDTRIETASVVDNVNSVLKLYNGWKDNYPNASVTIRLYANDEDFAESKWAEKTIILTNVIQ